MELKLQILTFSKEKLVGCLKICIPNRKKMPYAEKSMGGLGRIKEFLIKLKWLKKKRLFAFVPILLVRAALTPLGKDLKNRIFFNLKLNEIKRFVKYGSLKMVVRYDHLGLVEGIFELGIYDHYDEEKNDVVIDVGAHIGLSTIKLAEKFDEVVAIEPHWDNFQMLKQNIRFNGLTNVKLLRAAVADKDGHVTLHGSRRNATILPEIPGGEKQEVKAIKLEDITKTYPEVDLVKMNVEGAEEMIVRNGEKAFSNVRQVLVLVHRFIDGQRVENNMARLGFSLKRLPYKDKKHLHLYGKKRLNM